MKQFLQRITYKLQIWMQGRYGMDELNRTLNTSGIVIVLLSSFIPAFRPASFAGCVFIIIATLRTYSRNIYKRQQERAKYLKLTGGIRSWLSLQKRRWTDRKTHVYVKCSCGTVLRAPKGKGKIKLHCPKCGKETVVNS